MIITKQPLAAQKNLNKKISKNDTVTFYCWNDKVFEER